METNSLYIHIPFCQEICAYCDFCKVFYQKKQVDDYLAVLKKELTSSTNIMIKITLKEFMTGFMKINYIKAYYDN